MNRLIIAALLIAGLSSCATRNKPPAIASGPVQITGFDAAGNQTSTSYAGRTAAAGGAVNDTGEAAILAALAAKITGGDFTYASATRSAVTQPDTAIDSQIEEKHKAALSDAGAALAAGASGNYAKAIAEAASLGGQLIAARNARASAPKADTGAISTRILSSGEGHAAAATVGIQTFGSTLQAAKRASYSGTLNNSTVDTTTPEDIKAATELAILKNQLAIEKVRAEIAKAQQSAPVEQPVVFPPFELPAPSTNGVETLTLPELPQ